MSDEPIRFPAGFDTRIAVSDGEAFLYRLREFGFSDASVRTITNALSSDRSVTIAEFCYLLVNASGEAARDAVGRLSRFIACNVEPGCTLPIGHEGDCDLEIPF